MQSVILESVNVALIQSIRQFVFQSVTQSILKYTNEPSNQQLFPSINSWLSLPISQLLKESIKHKNRLFCINKKEKTEESLLKYKKYKSRLNGLLRRAKKDHYHSLFKSNEQNVKKSWAVMKTLINKTKSSEVQEI